MNKIDRITNAYSGKTYELHYMSSNGYGKGRHQKFERYEFYQIEKGRFKDKKTYLFGFDNSFDKKEKTKDALKRKGEDIRRSFLLLNNRILIPRIIKSLEANDSITLDLLQSYNSASPDSQADIILMLEKINKQYENSKTYPEDYIAKKKIEATNAYLEAMDELN